MQTGAGQDADGDGLADWVEYLLGRDHQQADHVEPLRVAHTEAGIAVTYSFNTLAQEQELGHVTLEGASTLEGTWQTIEGEVTGNTVTTNLPWAEDSPRFFRLRLEAGETLQPDRGLPNFSQAGFATLNGGCHGGADGETVIPETLEQLQVYCEDSSPRIILLAQPFDGGPDGLQINMGPDKSLIGLGDQGILRRIGIGLGSGTRNVILRNLSFNLAGITHTLTEEETGNPRIAINDGDAVRLFSMEEPITNVWIDHCEFESERPQDQPNGELYDGLVDITFRCQYITLSWCVFQNHNKTNLVGGTSTDTFDRKITYHHNVFRNVRQRTPSYRGGVGHLFNNYYDSVFSSGIHVRARGVLLIEKNHFFQCHHPILNEPGSGGRTIDNLFQMCTGSMTIPNALVFMPYRYADVITGADQVQADTHQWAGIGKLVDPVTVHTLD